MSDINEQDAADDTEARQARSGQGRFLLALLLVAALVLFWRHFGWAGVLRIALVAVG